MFLVFSCWGCCYECSNIYVSRAMCTDFPGHVYSGGIVGSQGLCILNFLGNTSLFPYNLVLLCILSLILWFLIIFSHLFFPKRICLQLLIGTWIPSFFPPNTVSRGDMASMGVFKEAVFLVVMMYPMSLVNDWQEQ